MRRFVFFLFIISCHCLHHSPFLLDVNAGGKALCPKHLCEMKGEGDKAFCERCRKDERGQENPPASINVDVDQLAKQITQAVMRRDTRQPSGGHHGGGSMVITPHSGLPQQLPLSSSFTFPVALPASGGTVQQHGENEPNLAANIGPQAGEESDTGPNIVPIEHMQQLDLADPQADAWQQYNQPYTAALTDMGIAAGQCLSGIYPVDIYPTVQDTDGSQLLRELQSISSQMDIPIRLRGKWVLPPVAKLFHNQKDLCAAQEQLQSLNLQYTGADLIGLADLLKQGKVIIRILQTDGSVLLLHIYPSGNLAILIMEDGLSTSASPRNN